MSAELLFDRLPSTWTAAQIGDVIPFSYGKGLSAKSRRSGNVAVYSSAGCVGSHDEPLVDGPVLIVGRKGAAGRVELSLGPTWVIDTAFYAPLPKGLDPRFMLYALRVARLDLLDQSTAIPSLSRDRLHAALIPIAPEREQERVVAAIEAASLLINDGAGGLTAAADDLRRYRDACLAAAFSGELLGVAPVVKPLDELAQIQSGIAKGRPASEATVDVPYIRTANVQAGRLDLDIIKTLPVTAEQRERYRLQPDDVLVLEGGDADKVGRGWLWQGEIKECLHQNHVFAVRADRDRLNPRYLAYYINSPTARAYFLACAKQTTNLASINKRQLKALPVPHVDPDEQQRIVTKLDEQMARARAFEDVLRSGADLAESLHHSLLHAAFRGRLSERIPEDEPAEVLLREIEVERAMVGAKRPGRKAKVS